MRSDEESRKIGQAALSLANSMRAKHGLTFRAAVNLEAAVTTALLEGANYVTLYNMFDNFLEHVEFEEEYEED